ncbi:MAG: DnaJ C-terminal domain-containing protein, partial [Desulfosalsimonas sp.]
RTEDGYHRAGIRRRKSDHLQVIRPGTERGSLDLYETIRVTPYEAAAGTRKMINMPMGMRNRLYRVLIPPGTSDGKVLRLKNLGKQDSRGNKGDLYLKIRIEQPW